MVKKIGPLSLAVPEEEEAPVDMAAGDDAVDDGGGDTPAGAVAGPLSITNDPKQYNATMQMLMGQLVDTPEQQRKNEILAWSSGMVDPSGQGNLGAIIGNSSKSELAYRMKDKELRAQYIPMIMQALGTTQKAGGVDLRSVDFRGMPEQEVAHLSVLAKRDLLPYWKQANFGEKQEAGTYTLSLDPKTRQTVRTWNLDPKNPLLVGPGNEVTVAKGGAESLGTLAAAQAEATDKSKAKWSQVTVVDPATNQPFTLFQSQANPELFAADASGKGAARLPEGAKITPTGGPAGPGGTPSGSGGTGGSAQGSGGPRNLTDAVAYVESTGDNSKVNPHSGAKGAMQVIDSTNGKPGFGVAPAKDNSIEERNRVGRDLLAAWQKSYGDNGGLVAYNWGPGNYEKWKAAGSKWSDLPKETQEYIGKVNLAKEGHNIYGGKQTAAASPQGQQTATAPPAAAKPLTPGNMPPGALPSGANPVVAQQQQEVGLANKVFIEKDIPAAQKVAEQASVMRDQVKQQRDAIAAGAASGRWADVITKASEFGAAFGWENADKIATSSGAFNNAVRKQVFSNLALQNGVQTEGDANRMREALVSLKDTPRLTAFLLAAADATAKRDQDKAAFYNKAAQQIRDGTLKANYADIDQAWRERMPPLHKMPEMKEFAEFITPKENKGK